jgi:ribosomal protein S18 acetylase RimI-like enzyme
MSAEPCFRLASESDAPTVLQFMCEYYACDGHCFREPEARSTLTALLRDQSLGQVWLIQEGDLPVGYAVLAFGYSLEWLGRDAFVDELYLREAFRGHGWGRMTLAFLEETARARSVRTLHLEVRRQNARALALYERVGFSQHESTLLSKRIR